MTDSPNAGGFDVCVLLATYQRPALLDQTLRSLAAQVLGGLSMAVVVVDNGGDEQTRAVAERHAGALQVRYLAQTARRGKSASVNLGLAQLPPCSLLVLTDDDIIAQPDWIAQLWAATERWPDAGVFGGRIVPSFPADTRGIDIASAWVRVALAVQNEDGTERYVPSGKLWGGNLALRASLLAGGARFNENLGPSDGNYATGCESDFTRRLEMQGVKCVFAPRAVVQHVVREEQLSEDWLCRRAYKHGEGDAAHTPIDGHVVWFGMPRWLLRQRVEWTLRSWRHALTGNRSKALDAKMELEFLRGAANRYAARGQRS